MLLRHEPDSMVCKKRQVYSIFPIVVTHPQDTAEELAAVGLTVIWGASLCEPGLSLQAWKAQLTLL